MRASIFLVAALLAGCNSSDSGLPQPGHYEGSLIRRDASGLSEIAVQADISNPDSGTWKVAIQQKGRGLIEEDVLKAQSDGGAALTIPSLELTQVAIQPQQGCYVADAKTQVHVCGQNGALLVEIRDAKGPVYSLSLQAFDSTAKTPVETPATYTLDAAMNRTFAMSFETRAQFERSMEASHVATNAYLNLLPRLNINAGTAVATAFTDITQLIGGIGDLLPFLLPTRWIDAENAGIDANAQKIALWVMRGDSGLEVESLAYSWISDGLVIGDYREVLGQSETLVKQIRFLEQMGEYPAGTADTIQTSIDGMKADLAVLSAAREDKKTVLAQAMGFISPEAVIAVTLDTVTEESDLDHLQEGPFEDQVVGRSLELDQLDQLIETARNTKTATYFEWLDPAGGPNSSLGAAIGTSVEIAQDKIDELELQRSQLEATLRQKARSALDDFNTAHGELALANAAMGLQQKRVTNVLDTIKYGKDTNQVELAAVYQDLLRAMIGQRDADAAILIARAKINRLLLEGYYSRLAFAGSVH